ncbi:hypothetical protein Tco_1136916, partial [Tanacetum coccineum]
MCTYLKNMAGFTHSQLKNKSFDEVQKAFNKTMGWIDSFLSIDSEVVKGELEQERIKKQKIDDDQEKAKMKKHMEIVVDEEEIAVDAIPLANKPPIIVDWKIIKEGKIGYFQIIRADGSSRRYSSMIKMLQKMLFDNTMKWVDSFVPMDSEVVERSKSQAEGIKKRTREELESDNSKKQKIDENVEAEVDDEIEMKKLMEIVPDDEVAIDAIPLATKSPIIVEWKIIKKDEAVHKELGDSLVRVSTTASSLEAEQDRVVVLGAKKPWGDTIAQTRFESVSKHSNDLQLARGKTLQSVEDRLKLDELMALCTTLQNSVLDLEKTMTTQQNKIDSLNMRVKK